MAEIDQILSEEFAKIDAEEAGIVDDTDKGADDEQATKDAGTDDKSAGKDDTKSGDDAGSDAASDDDTDTDAKDAEDEAEGEYTADDALEVEETPVEASAPTDQAGIQLSPAEQKYVVENIGDPLTLTGYRLDKEGNQVEYEVKVYAANQLPRDFNFASDADRLNATNAFNALEQKAQNLVGTFRAEQSKQQAAEFERRENESIRSDVADLQKEGRLPKFRVRPGEVGFDEDPAAQIVDEVLKIMADKNKKYLEDSNKGKAYRHIGFEQAFDIWERTNPQRKAARETDAKQDAEDTARKSKAERSNANRGELPNIMKAAVPAGTTTRDLMTMLDNEDL